jgi:hypothetical protein
MFVNQTCLEPISMDSETHALGYEQSRRIDRSKTLYSLTCSLLSAQVHDKSAEDGLIKMPCGHCVLPLMQE